MVLLMSVYPGYGGQKFIPEVLEKVVKAREYAIKSGRPELDIEIDGDKTSVHNIAVYHIRAARFKFFNSFAHYGKIRRKY